MHVITPFSNYLQVDSEQRGLKPKILNIRFFNYLQVDSEQRGLLLGVLRDMERDPESFTDRQIMVPRAVYL